MTHYTTTSANINSASFRADQRPRPTTCQICHEVPAVRRVTHHDRHNDVYITADCCAYCASKVGK